MKDIIISEQYLLSHPNEIFVFGDNLLRVGRGGAAKFRHLPNTYGFVTKKAPTNRDKDFYKPDEYLDVFRKEFDLLCDEIESNPDKIYLISRIGSGLANKYKIWELIISAYIDELIKYENVRFLFELKFN